MTRAEMGVGKRGESSVTGLCTGGDGIRYMGMLGGFQEKQHQQSLHITMNTLHEVEREAPNASSVQQECQSWPNSVRACVPQASRKHTEQASSLEITSGCDHGHPTLKS